jgi:hypothetical protein
MRYDDASARAPLEQCRVRPQIEIPLSGLAVALEAVDLEEFVDLAGTFLFILRGDRTRERQADRQRRTRHQFVAPCCPHVGHGRKGLEGPSTRLWGDK